MGNQVVGQKRDAGALRRFARHLIQDVRALEYMLQHDMLESGVSRIGAEQELFLVNDRWQPAPVAEAMLAACNDGRIVNELARFNLEFNLEPLPFGGDCLLRMEQALNEVLSLVRELATEAQAEVVLSGILPTIHLSDLTLENLTPRPRYYALNEAISLLRGGPGALQIRGVDELFVKHDGIILEGCNTSFQTHFQVSPNEFARYYNIAQVIAAPVLACAVNSPVLFGKRLWRETRIALFQQAVDTRSSNLYLREMSPRVHFGTEWLKESVVEIFKEDIARFQVLLAGDDFEDPFEVLDQGGVPRLQALQLHNGTVYRWNRACYGVYQGKPHLRIENRILPSGPTVADEVANAAFWFGLVSGFSKRYDDVTTEIEFDDAKSNFIAAARLGLASQLAWFRRRRFPAHELITHELLPMAREGLTAAGTDAEDIDRYLGIIEERVATRQTGAQWQLDSLAGMKGKGARAERLASLTAAMSFHQKEGSPVHTWPLAQLEGVAVSDRLHNTRVEHFMTTDLFTVHEEELVELVAALMDWRRIRHILVEDDQHQLVGLVTHRSLLRFLAEQWQAEGPVRDIPVKEIMVHKPISVAPETSTMEAIRIMRAHGIGSLPVVRDGQLLGIITERDFIHIAGQLLDESILASRRTASPQ